MVLVDQFFDDLATCEERGDIRPSSMEVALRGWLWSTCPASRRAEVEAAIRAETRFRDAD